MDNKIIVKNLHFSYLDDKSVLKGINFEVRPNEIVGLLGANGSGKTTTFKLLSGLLTPDEGEITIDGLSIIKNLHDILKISAFIPDESLLYPNLSAEENMNLFAILWGVDSIKAKKRAQELLQEVGLWTVKNQWISSYSKGMKQKLSICAALLHEPKLLLMDEPFNGLDIDALVWAREMLKSYVSQAERSIIFTSHTPEVVESLANRVIILQDGIICHEELISTDPKNRRPLIEIYKEVVKI